MLLGLGNGEGQSVQSIFETGRLHIHDIWVQVCGLEAGGCLLTGSPSAFSLDPRLQPGRVAFFPNSLGWVLGCSWLVGWLSW